MHNRMSRKEVSRTAVTILAALSISIGTTTLANAKSSPHRHHHSTSAAQLDGELIAGFPFRKPKGDVKTNSAKDSDKTEDKDSSKNPENNSEPNSDNDADKRADVSTDKNSDKKTDNSSDKSSNSSAKAADKDKNKGKEKGKEKSASVDKKKAKAEEKAAAKTQEDKEDAEKEAAKLAKKSEKKKSQDEKKRKDDAADAAKTAEDTVNRANEDKAAADKAAAEKVATDKAAADKVAADKATVDKADSASRSGYVADTALISLLNDLARALKDPAEQAKLGDENQRFVVQRALDVLSKALETRNDANRIVDRKSMTGTPMSAEAWSSGDIKVSTDCRGSLAAVWAKKENGILNVTIAGACGDKVAPSGKNVGEYVVVLSARSTVQKGFDIQTQADVTFWLAKLSSVSVDAACCNTESADNTVSVDSETKELKKNSTVVLQAIMTERERLFSNNNNSNNNNNSSTTSSITTSNGTKKLETPVVVKENPTSKKEKAAAERKAKEDQLAAAEAEQRRQEKQDLIAAAEKQRQIKEEQQRAEAESKRKLEEEDRRAEAQEKQRHEEELRLAQAEKQRKTAEKERLAAEKDQKAAEKERLATIEKEQKQAEKGAGSDKKRQRDEEKKLADTKKKLDQDHILQADLNEKSEETARKNSRLSREDAILAEATRQAEFEQLHGTSMRTTRDDAILAEATREAELDQAHGISVTRDDPRPALNEPRLTRDDAILAEATRQAEQERREAADMRIPFTSYNSDNYKNSGAPTVEIDDQQTALRPTPTADGSSVAAAPLAPQAAPPSSEALMQYPPPASQVSTEAGAPTLLANREASKGWDSPGVPTDVQPPSNGATMVLPERAIAGQYITASVIDANNAGESGIELGFNGVSLATDVQGQVTFLVPEDAVPGNSLTVAMTGRSGIRPFAIEVLQPLTTSSQQDAPSVDRTSPMVSAHGTVIIDGHNFDGRADHNKVLVDENVECKITAASPVQLRATLPANLPPGVHFATVRCGQNKSNPGRFDLVTAEVQPDPKEAGKEQETKLVVKVLGTTNKVQVHLTNQNPDVIKISKGNDFRLTMPGGDNNSTIVSVQRLRKGSYRVVAVVE